MIKFIELSTIGVSRDSQLRAARILEVIINSSQNPGGPESGESFFKISYHFMAERWQLLREAVNKGRFFSLPDFQQGFCQFLNQVSQPQPGKQKFTEPLIKSCHLYNYLCNAFEAVEIDIAVYLCCSFRMAQM